jgi:hypothetical protein
VLTVHGGLLVAVRALVLSGLVSPSGSVDRTALRWHVLLWDLWFLVWGCCSAWLPGSTGHLLALAAEELRSPVLDEAAVREAQQLERLAGDRSAGVIGSVPAQPQRRLVLGGDEVLDRDAHVSGLMDGLHHPAEPVRPANLDIAQALVVDVLLGDRRIGRDRAGVLAMTRTRSGPSRTLPPHVTFASARNPSTEPVRHQMPAPVDRVHRLVRKTATVRHPTSLRSLVGANHGTDTIDKAMPVQQAPRHASSRDIGPFRRSVAPPPPSAEWGRSELVSEINVSRSADPQLLRLSLWDICSAADCWLELLTSWVPLVLALLVARR